MIDLTGYALLAIGYIAGCIGDKLFDPMRAVVGSGCAILAFSGGVAGWWISGGMVSAEARFVLGFAWGAFLPLMACAFLWRQFCRSVTR